MTVKNIMSSNVACCQPSTSIQQVARMMIEHDCGEIPVTNESNKPVGVVTDRDICCRGVAEGRDANTPASEIMTTEVVTCTTDMSIEDCCALMEQHLIRRVPVVDMEGAICGIVSQADFAKKTGGQLVDDLLKEVSTPSQSAHA